MTNNYGRDRLNWKAIFPKREASINSSKIVINLPKSLVGKIENYYTIGGNFKPELIDDASIQFTSLKSLAPENSVVAKVTFSGNYLNFPQHNSFIAIDKEIPFTFKSIFGYTLVGLVCLVFFASIFIFVYVFFRAITSNLSNNSTKRDGDCITSGGCCGCCGCCGGCGCCGCCGGGG